MESKKLDDSLSSRVRSHLLDLRDAFGAGWISRWDSELFAELLEAAIGCGRHVDGSEGARPLINGYMGLHVQQLPKCFPRARSDGGTESWGNER